MKYLSPGGACQTILESQHFGMELALLVWSSCIWIHYYCGFMYESHTKNSLMLKNTLPFVQARHGPPPLVLVWNWHYWYGIHTVGPIIYYTLCTNSIPKLIILVQNTGFNPIQTQVGMEFAHKV